MEEITLIRNYIKGMLSGEESKQVEARLQSDAEFRKLHDEQRVVMRGISLAERDRLKGLLQEEKQTKFNYWYAAVAMVPLLIAAYFVLWAPSDSNDLFESYYEPYGVYEFGEVRGSDSVNIREVDAFRMYSNEDYEQAESAISDLLKAEEKQGYYLYLAVSQIELEQYDVAIESLNKIDDNSNYSSISKWYKALTYLKLNRRPEAEKLLQELVHENNGLATKAEELLNQL